VAALAAVQPLMLEQTMLVVQELLDRVMLVEVMADLPQARMVLAVVEAQEPQQPQHLALHRQQVVLGQQILFLAHLFITLAAAVLVYILALVVALLVAQAVAERGELILVMARLERLIQEEVAVVLVHKELVVMVVLGL
jgi:hypothetical protein